MSIYAIGDVQGCYDSLQSLLQKVRFDPAKDQLWFVGDLVNRGPDSLKVLRFVKGLGEHAITVLGNHDLHLLAVAEGLRKDKHHDLGDILAAPDKDELLTWLRQRPLLHHDKKTGYTMIHAGLPPQWDLATAQRCAQELERVLRSSTYHKFLTHMYGDEPASWAEDHAGWERLRFICNCFTRLRYCDKNGKLELKSKGAPGTQPKGLQPWFAWPERNSRDLNIVFGHWSTLGAYSTAGIHALDTGCVWGGKLSALQLDTFPSQLFQVDCPAAKNIGED